MMLNSFVWRESEREYLFLYISEFESLESETEEVTGINVCT